MAERLTSHRTSVERASSTLNPKSGTTKPDKRAVVHRFAHSLAYANSFPSQLVAPAAGQPDCYDTHESSQKRGCKGTSVPVLKKPCTEQARSLTSDDLPTANQWRPPFDRSQRWAMLKTFDPSQQWAMLETSHNLDLDHFPPHCANKHGDIEPAALLRLHEALKAVSIMDKIDYLTALQNVPELVLEESEPIKFLRFHDFNAAAAAQGLIRYWKQRRDVFQERAFLPLTITGDGALKAPEIEYFKSAHVVFTAKDRGGSTVVIFDGSQCPPSCPKEISRRSMFYVGHLLAESSVSQEVGHVMLCILNTNDHKCKVSDFLSMLFDTFPFKIKAWHIFECTSNINRDHQRFMNKVLNVFGGQLRSQKIFFHAYQPKEETAEHLELQHGVTRECLPTCLGGTYTYDQFEDWVQERVRWESERYSHTRRISMGRSVAVEPVRDCVQEPKASVVEMSGQQNEDRISEVHDELVQFMKNEISRIPLEEKQVYLEALQKAPTQVWEEECPYLGFLRVEQFDVKCAAERMVRYWRLRYKLFQPRHFQCINLSGEEALTQKEISCLRTAFVSLLPNDAHGRSVMYIDPARRKPGTPTEILDRCVFYIMSLLAENEMTQTTGAILLHKMDPPGFELYGGLFLKILIRALPISFKDVHLISLCGISNQVLSSIPNLGATVHVNTGEKKDDLCANLEKFGMKRDHLPKFVNGGWGVEKFMHWQEVRTRLEWQHPAGLSGREQCSDTHKYPAVRPYVVLPEEQHVERKRRLNVLYSRRKRDRERTELAVLEEQCIELTHEQEKLHQERQELENLVKEAKKMVDLTEERALDDSVDNTSNSTDSEQPDAIFAMAAPSARRSVHDDSKVSAGAHEAYDSVISSGCYRFGDRVAPSTALYASRPFHDDSHVSANPDETSQRYISKGRDHLTSTNSAKSFICPSVSLSAALPPRRSVQDKSHASPILHGAGNFEAPPVAVHSNSLISLQTQVPQNHSPLGRQTMDVPQTTNTTRNNTGDLAACVSAAQPSVIVIANGTRFIPSMVSAESTLPQGRQRLLPMSLLVNPTNNIGGSELGGGPMVLFPMQQQQLQPSSLLISCTIPQLFQPWTGSIQWNASTSSSPNDLTTNKSTTTGHPLHANGQWHSNHLTGSGYA